MWNCSLHGIKVNSRDCVCNNVTHYDITYIQNHSWQKECIVKGLRIPSSKTIKKSDLLLLLEGTTPIWADLLNQLWGWLIKPYVNNSSQLRYRAKIRHAPSPGRSASYRSCANARHLSKAGALPQCLSSQSTSAVIKCADKATNKPKASESITDFCVWHEDWSLLRNREITLREMGWDDSHTVASWIVFLLCFFSFVSEG